MQEETVKETCLHAPVLFSPRLLSLQLEALQEVQALLGRIGPLHTINRISRQTATRMVELVQSMQTSRHTLRSCRLVCNHSVV